MIRLIAITILLVLAGSTVSADQHSANKMIKDCLDVWGYDREAPVDVRLNNFNWQGASECVAGFQYEEHLKRKEAIKTFLAEKPWFKGSNWKWQEKAEYTCRKITTLKGTYEICSKPIYIN